MLAFQWQDGKKVIVWPEALARWRRVSPRPLGTSGRDFARYSARAPAVHSIRRRGAQAHRIYRIGVLMKPGPPTIPRSRDSKRAFASWASSRAVTWPTRYASPRASPAPPPPREELVKAGVDLIFTVTNRYARGEEGHAAHSNRFYPGGDPVATGMVASLARPGGNLTGISSRATELAPKRLEVLKTLAPELRRVWYVYHKLD